MRALGFGKTVIFSNDLMFVVRDVSMQYLLPARLDEELTATARVVDVGGAYIDIAQRVVRDDECLCTGEVRIVCVDRSGLKPRRIPRDMLAAARSQIMDDDEANV